MATDVLFPLYSLLVERIFGSIWLSIFGIAAVLIVLLALCRSSRTFIINWIVFYIIVMGTMYFGALALVAGFIIGLGYVLYPLIIQGFMNER